VSNRSSPTPEPPKSVTADDKSAAIFGVAGGGGEDVKYRVVMAGRSNQEGPLELQAVERRAAGRLRSSTPSRSVESLLHTATSIATGQPRASQ
jgi:hypothetical protein